MNIFWRIMVGYLLVILILMIIIAFSLVNLNRMTRIINVLIYSDQQAIDLEKKMVDSFLSQVRNFQKYQVTGDEAFLNLSRAGHADFLEYSRQLTPKLRSAEERGMADKILATLHDYDVLVENRTNPLDRGNLSSAETGARANTAEGMTGALDSLVNLQQKRTMEQTQGLKAMGARAARVVQVLIVISLFSAVIIAFLVTKGINDPLLTIKKMTTVVAAGDFDQHVELDSPPELVELARSFNQMSDQLKRLDEMKSGFISHVSHELRTPLASMKEANNLLLEEAGGKITAQQRRFLTIIEQGTNKLTKMIDDLLDLSKMEAGMTKYDFIPADIRPILAHALAEVELLAEKKGLHLSSEATDTLPRVWMDINKIQQVVVNLLSNAIKFTPERERIEVKTDLYHALPGEAKNDREDDYLRVRIADTGIGIPPEFQARIFDKFLDIIPKGIPGTKGTGLGLSIARHIVQAHGGQIWAESTPGKGSIFTFILPLKKGPEDMRPPY
jgi:two-component system sensor histidine kinase GlrK